MYGQLAEQREQAIETMMRLLEDLKAGRLTLEQVVVDENGWHVEEAANG